MECSRDEPGQPSQKPSNNDNTANLGDEIEFSSSQRSWSQEYLDPNMPPAQKSEQTAFKDIISSMIQSAEDIQREGISSPYRDHRFQAMLRDYGSFMGPSPLGLSGDCKDIIDILLLTDQEYPKHSLFKDKATFAATCQKMQHRNRARVVKDIGQLIVPSVENLASSGFPKLGILAESVNERWSNSIALIGDQPMPTYSVGFARGAFTELQLQKLSACVTNPIAGDISLMKATYYMYLPFLTTEVGCGSSSLDEADRQNAHTMTVAVQGVVELFRLAGRADEINRECLGFSISYDHRSVRIYGHYAVIDEKKTEYYRHPIRTYDFTELEGKEKWTSYTFVRNVYDLFAPFHILRIRSAIDALSLDPSKGILGGVPSHPL